MGLPRLHTPSHFCIIFTRLWLAISSPLGCKTTLGVCVPIPVSGYDFYNHFQIPIPQSEYQSISKGTMEGNKLMRIIKSITEPEGTAPWWTSNSEPSEIRKRPGKFKWPFLQWGAQGSHDHPAKSQQTEASWLGKDHLGIQGFLLAHGAALGVWTSVRFPLL